MPATTPLVLAIVDGAGIAPQGPANPFTMANIPKTRTMWESYAHTQLISHGDSVGLPKKEPGNTETGHLNIGAGRIVYQDLLRINLSIADGSFFHNPALLKAALHVKHYNSKFHILGLLSSGGVHSDLSHIQALLRFCHEQHLDKVFIHVITDGRDSPPSSSRTFVDRLAKYMQQEHVGRFASVIGRYYAMDRDFHWDRTARAYFCLTRGIGKTSPTITTAIESAYSVGQTDEFIQPTTITGPNNLPVALVQDSDAVVFANFRVDRPRQLTKAFILQEFTHTANLESFDPYRVKYFHSHVKQLPTPTPPFDRKQVLNNLFFVTMTEYEHHLPVQVAFPPQDITETFGEVVSQAGLRQLRLAESEKERFVTYYFNGQREDPFPGEFREIIPSPRVPTYDLQPEMSARKLTDTLVSHLTNADFDVYIVNFANPDMVAHTGNIPAAITACEVVDECLGKVADLILSLGGVLVITSDHGNVENMLNTEHDANPVPFILVGKDFPATRKLSPGVLADIAPTLLSILNIPVPSAMTGRNLLA